MQLVRSLFMQINLPIQNLSRSSDSGEKTPRLEKTDAAENFDHYLGTGETDKTPAAKCAEQRPEAKQDKAEAKSPKDDEVKQDPGLLPTAPALNQAPPAPLPISVVSGNPAAAEGASAVSLDGASAFDLAATPQVRLPVISTSASSLRGLREAQSPAAPQPQSGIRTMSSSTLDLPLPTAGEPADNASPEASLFPSPETPTSPLVVAGPADLQQVEPSAIATTAESRAATTGAAQAQLEANVPSVAAPVLATAAAKPGGQAELNAPDEDTSDLPPLQISSAASVQLPRGGTRAAMERNTMSDALLSRQAKAKAAGFTASEKSPLLSASIKPATAAPAVSANARPAANVSSPPADLPSSESLAPLGSALGATAQTNSTPASQATPKAAALPADAAVALQRVQEMGEHLHTTGHRSVELEVQLEGEQRLTISLHMERGELKTTFKTDSTELRNALAQNWGQVAEKGDRSLRFNPPVFESPSAQSGSLNDPRQQGRQDRAFSENSEGQRFTFQAPAPAKTNTATRPASASTTSGLELYA